MWLQRATRASQLVRRARAPACVVHARRCSSARPRTAAALPRTVLADVVSADLGACRFVVIGEGAILEQVYQLDRCAWGSWWVRALGRRADGVGFRRSMV